MHCYLGVDIGTSGCKAVVFDENGTQLHVERRTYSIISENEGWAELDTDEVIDQCFAAIRESASRVLPDKISGLGISSQGEAFTILDKKGQTLSRALVSSDRRAETYAATWPEAFGPGKLYNITGHSPHPMFSLFKLLWIRDHMPEIWQKAERILCFEDLLQYRLGIEDPAISWSLAGRTMMFDVVNHCWSREILDMVGIRPRQLAKPLPPGEVAGHVSKEMARKLNLAGQPVVVAGGHDQPCSALGAGIVTEGIAAYATGTVECITSTSNTPLFSPDLMKSNMCTYDHAIRGKYATVSFNLTGGNLLQWFRDEIRNDSFGELLNQMPEEPSRLLVLPYFAGTGTPYFDTAAKGAIIGLDFSTTRGEIIKALLEGITMEMKLNLEILEKAGYRINELRIIGGGARSGHWNQIKADVLGKPVTVPDVTEAASMGVAILARAAHMQLPVEEVAGNWVKPTARIIPGNTHVYEEKYITYRKLYPALKSI